MSMLPQKSSLRRPDDRWPVMPLSRDMLSMPSHPRPSGRERCRPANGPSIDDWEAAMLGRQLVKKSAAYTMSQSKTDDFPSVASVRGVLLFCIYHADGALARIPTEIVQNIEQILHDTVCSSFIDRASSTLSHMVSLANGSCSFRHSNAPIFPRVRGTFRMLQLIAEFA